MYQIPTFEEFINERLFKSSIDRIKSGEARLEDSIGNLHQLQEINLSNELSFVFSDIYFNINGELEITANDFYEIYDKIKESGWRLMNENDLEEFQKYIGNHNKSTKYRYTSELPYDFKFDKSEFKPSPWGQNGFVFATSNKKPIITLKDKETKNEVDFYCGAYNTSCNSELLELTNPKNENFYTFQLEIRTENVLFCHKISNSYRHTDSKFLIRLIKDKKS